VLKQVTNVEMNVVAAVPPSPPPLEAMAQLSPVHTKGKAAGGGAAAAEGGEDAGGGDAQAMPTSRVEGSVEAIAQRIYHRIRRRIASDRERFGG
jgi:hypothetical protein